MRIPTTFNRMGLSPSGGGGGMPTSGLVFYAPLAEKVDYAETGQTLNYANINQSDFTTLYGIPCLCKNTFDKSILASLGTFTGNAPFTMSVWCNFMSKRNWGAVTVIGKSDGFMTGISAGNRWNKSWNICKQWT